MSRFLQQIESNIEENILTSSDCSDQLKGFLELRSRFTKENDKPYASLKFSNQIAVSSNEQIIVNSVDFEEISHKEDSIDKLNKMKTFLSCNQYLLSEKQRRKFFVIQQKMLVLFRKFTNRYNSQVTQKAQGSCEKTQGSSENVYEITRFNESFHQKARNENQGDKEALSSFDRSYSRYYNSLKKLKAKDKPEFEEIVSRMKGIKGKFRLRKYILEI